MTLRAGMNPNDDEELARRAAPGTGLTPVDRTAGLDPFLAATGNRSAPERRSFVSRLFDYSAHAAMIVGLLGFAWTVSEHVISRPSGPPAGLITTGEAMPAKPPAVAAKRENKLETKTDDMVELRRTNQRMAADLKALRAKLDTLTSAVSQDRTREQISTLLANMRSVNSGLASAKTETASALAQLSGKIDKMQHEALAKPAPRAVRQPLDPDATGSLASAAGTRTAPLPPQKPVAVKLASAEETRRSPKEEPAPKKQVIAEWVVRDVYDGVALIEGKRGPLEVVRGVGIPGAGVVKSIERHGKGWTVTTTKGLIAYAAPEREYRRSMAREQPYRPYRYDF